MPDTITTSATSTNSASSGTASRTGTSALAGAPAAAPFGARLILGLAPDGMALLRSNGVLRRGWQVLSQTGFATPLAPDAALIELQAQLAQTDLGKLPLTIILDDRWVRYFMVTPPKNLSHFDDCAAATRMRFHSLYGEAPDGWQIEAVYSPNLPFLACALPKTLLHSLQKIAHEQKSPLLGVAPHFITCFNRWRSALNGQAWFALAHQDTLTLAAIEQGRLRALRSSRLAESDWLDLPAVAEHVQREALRLNLAMPNRLQLCGNIPGNWARHSAGSLTLERLDGAARPGSGQLAGAKFEEAKSEEAKSDQAHSAELKSRQASAAALAIAASGVRT
jgi:hypothetical protein